MNQFQQFDISDFLNEIQEPLFLMDAEEIIFLNDFFQNNFQAISDSWESFFDHLELQKEIKDFYESGKVPGNLFVKSLVRNDGQKERYEWAFINLPSSFNSRFLIAKGSQIKMDSSGNTGLIVNSGETLSGELRYMQSILNNSHDLIAILDKNGVYKFISDSVAEKLGFPASMILGKNYLEFASEGRIEIVKGDFKEVLNSEEEVSIDFWVKMPDGKRIFLESFAKNLLNHPQIQGIIVSSRDITDYVLTERHLQRRYEIENLINKISSRLINGSFGELRVVFFQALSKFGEFFNAKRAAMLVFNQEVEGIEVLSSWSPLEDEYQLNEPDKNELSLIFENQPFLEKGKVRIVSLDFPSQESVKEEVKYPRILVPMISSKRLLGIVSFEFEGEELAYEEREIQVLRQLGDILAGAYLASQMTRKLERNENLLASTELLSNSGSWNYSSFTKRFYLSGGLAYMFGMGDKPIVTDFSSLIYKIDKNSRQDFILNLRNATKHLSRTSGEFTITDEGRVKYISYEIEGKKDFLTQGLEIYGFCTDVTRKRDAESYLKLQSQILAQVSDPILVTNLQLEVIYLNEAAVQLCCPETARDFDGSITDLLTVDWENEERLLDLVSNLQMGEVWKAVRYLQTLHTHRSPFDFSVQPIFDESKEKIGYSVVLRGLAEKYKSEQLAKRAQLIVENSPAVLFRVDPNLDYQIVYISENISRFGYDAAFLIDQKVSFLDLLHPDDADYIKSNFVQNSSPEGILSFSGEYRIKTASGQFVWVEDRTRDVISDSGQIVIHEGLFQDVSDRKNLEEIQNQRDKRYRVLAANIPDTNIFLLDTDRKYILAEGTNFERWGLKREDFEGKYLKDLQLSPFEEISSILDRVYEKQEIVESEFLYKGRYYHRVIRPIVEDGEVAFALSIVRDINKESQTKLDLLQSEEKYRRLVEGSTEIIFSLTETFLLNYVSPNVKQFLGYDLEEVTGRSIFDFLNPDDLGVFREMLGESKDFLAENQHLEYRLRHKNGEYRVFSSNGKLLTDKDGIHRYYTGVARDISKLKEAQRELMLAKDKAEQASQIKSQFLSVMSHEIRTPMNAVIGLAHFLMEENPRPDQMENLKTLQFSAENLMALINDILDYNKIDSGKVDLERIPFDIRNMVHRIVHSYSFQAGEKSLRISCEIDETIPQTLIGDSLRLGQVINNLVSNAIKFTEVGFVRISLIREYTHRNRTDIRFVFKDTGIGIPEHKLNSIFEAFTQASSSTSRKYGGTGLGLAIVKRLVELHGGEIEVKSQAGGGSVFEFTLSFEFLDSNTQEANKSELSKSAGVFENAAILVAEDNVVNQILIRKFLTKWNTGNLVIASDGKEALEQFEKRDFDLVLLDLQMPELDGFQVAKAIRSMDDPQKSQVPILALTAASLNEVREDILLNGIDDFIPKPFSPESLFEKILKNLHSKRTS